MILQALVSSQFLWGGVWVQVAQVDVLVLLFCSWNCLNYKRIHLFYCVQQV